MIDDFSKSDITKVYDYHPISVLIISLLKYNETSHDEMFQAVSDLITGYDEYCFDKKMMALIIGVHLVTNAYVRKTINCAIISELTDILFRIFCDLNGEFYSKFDCDCDVVCVLSFLNEIGCGKICRSIYIGILLVYSSFTSQHPGLFFVSEQRYIIYYGTDGIQSSAFKQIILDSNHPDFPLTPLGGSLPLSF